MTTGVWSAIGSGGLRLDSNKQTFLTTKTASINGHMNDQAHMWLCVCLCLQVLGPAFTVILDDVLEHPGNFNPGILGNGSELSDARQTILLATVEKTGFIISISMPRGTWQISSRWQRTHNETREEGVFVAKGAGGGGLVHSNASIIVGATLLQRKSQQVSVS